MTKVRKSNLFIKTSVLIVSVALFMLVAGIVWIQQQQRAQSEREMLETTRVLAKEMDSVWTFMERNQSQFKLGRDGTYNLYCVVAVKSISMDFTRNSGYTIRYTNTETRKPTDSPDAFEQQALSALKADTSLSSYSGFDKYEGEEVFRYCEPVHLTESCLECHGGPAGELDQKGYPKEGLKEGDIFGVASIIMPTTTYKSTQVANVIQEFSLLFLMLAGCLIGVFIAITHFITRPIKVLQGAINHVEKGEFAEGLADFTRIEETRYADEITDLSKRFKTMTSQLKGLYGSLSSQVEEQTKQLSTANKTLEEQRIYLEKVNEKLQEDNRFKSDFLSIMSHELRTPLTSVLAFADIWSRTYGPRDVNEAKVASEITYNIQAILGIVNNILETARMEAGRLTLDLEPVDLFDIVPLVKQSTSALALKKQITVLTNLDPDTPIVRADGEKVRRILENLISNAIKFTDQNGEVIISTQYDREDESVLLSVKDNGKGISPEDREHIFESFIQGTHEGIHIGGGSGLGLSVVKQLAELHGGRVEVFSEVGKGSTFKVWIPVGDNESGELE